MYEYAEKEWSLLGIGVTILGCLLAFLFVYLEYGAYEFAESAPVIVPVVLIIGFLNIVLFRKMSIRITKTEIKISAGIFRRRKIRIADIASVERTKVGFWSANTHKGWFVKVERYAVAKGDAFQINIKKGCKGKPCIVQSRNTEEVLKVLRRIDPAIEIR